MKGVLLVTQHYPPDGDSAGVIRTLKFSKYLPLYRWIPHILTLKEWVYQSKDYSLVADIPQEAIVHRTFALDSSRHLAIKGRHLAFCAVPDRFVTWIPFGVWGGLRVIKRQQVRVLYSTSPPPTAHLIAAALKSMTDLPWVADFRDPWVEESGHPHPGTLRYRVESGLERFVVRRADCLITTTPYHRSDLLSRYPELVPSKVQVIYNGYDESDFQGLATLAQGDRFELIHAGLVTHDFRNPFPLLRAVVALLGSGVLRKEDIRVTFLGGGSYVLSRDFAEQVRSLGLEDVVAIVDRVPHRDALQRLRRAAVLLLLQASDDTRSLIPGKAFEYLRIDRPILALTLGGATADLLKGMEECYVVNPADESGLRSAVMSLYGAWKRSPGPLQVSRRILQYERKNLTGELAGLLEKL